MVVLNRLKEKIDDWRYGAYDPTASLGQRGEQAAERYLRKHGYRILFRNERTKFSEIDLIAERRRTLVFVEVKSRSSQRKGHPADHVDDEKERRLTRAAIAFLKRHRLLDCHARIDVIAVWWPPECDRPERIVHYENAVQGIDQQQIYT